MNHEPQNPGHAGECVRADLAGDLIRWDELDFRRRLELERHAAVCVSCGPALALLRRADAWLNEPTRGPSTSSVPTGECPEAEALYDFGHGPGARSLPSERRGVIAAHLVGCADCRALVATLASRPPAPLVLDQPTFTVVDAEDEGALDLELGGRSIPAKRWLWIPAAAAVLLFAVGFWWKDIFAADQDTLVAQGIYPAEEVLRGNDGGPLYFPRDAVLAIGDHPWKSVVFEIEPIEHATLYRITLTRRDDGVLGAEREVARWETAEPTSSLDASELALGRYTWEVWAVVDRLDKPVGRRDFEVRADPATEEQLFEALQLTGDARTAEVLRVLHARGYLGDARAFARTLPPSPDRDAYLARKPGR
jgi:hypothetical protein